MATQTLVLTGDDKHFSLSLADGTLTVGDPAHPDGVARGLRVRRIRCEVEIEGDGVALDDPAGGLSVNVVRPGETVRVGHLDLSVTSTQSPVPPDDTELEVRALPPAPAAKPSAPPHHLRVVDGADQGRRFPLPPSGAVSIGKNARYAGIVLHDLYVARVHCELTVEDGLIIVSHIEGDGGTRVDGAVISEPTVLRPGSVLRVGNSHLRLELGPVEPSLEDFQPAGTVGSSHILAGGSGMYKPVGPASGAHKPVAAPKAVAAKPADVFAQLEGQGFGHYRLGPVVGRGHTGAVLEAHDLNADAVVALKVLSADFPVNHAELDRFAQAMAAAAKVPHDNVATLYGGGRTAGHCWIAREWIDGESAAAVIRRTADGDKPSWSRACRVAVHLGRALAAIHGHKVVHGNITPKNVLIRSEDHATKLTDLLLAQALDGSKLRTAVTEKKLAAELPYLAPEQTAPGAFVDQLADLYAVGAVVYALVAGRPPFVGDSRKELVAAIQAGRAVKPSAHYRKVPPAFDAVVMKLLACHQEDRYQTAKELLKDVETVAADHDIAV